MNKLLDELDELCKFRARVHERLDQMNVPVDPFPDQTREHGSRIEGRLDWVEGQLALLDTFLVCGKDEFNSADEIDFFEDSEV